MGWPPGAKYAWIAGQGKAFALAEMCEVLDVNISGYRAWKSDGAPDRQRLTDGRMLALIQSIHAEHKGAYGTWCVHCVREAFRQVRSASNG